MNRRSVPALLSLNRFETDDGSSHIAVDNQICETRCTQRACLTVCPADVYSDQDGHVIPDFAACVECGTCIVACLPEALSWRYPRGGYGIQYRYG